MHQFSYRFAYRVIGGADVVQPVAAVPVDDVVHEAVQGVAEIEFPEISVEIALADRVGPQHNSRNG